jgi:FkbM family methyltransferase
MAAEPLAALLLRGERIASSARGWLMRLYDHPYNQSHPVSALGRLAKWHALRASGRPWDLRFWGTRVIRCYPDSDGSMWLILNVVMDWPEFHFMRAYLRASDTFVDVGANIGIYTLWASQFVDASGRIIAFEPDAANHERLRAQLDLNGLPARVEVERIALSDRAGEVRLSQGADMTNHLVIGTESTPFTVVRAETLDGFCRDRGVERIAFMKIDVEGAEQLVLEGARGMLGEHRVDALQLEFNQQANARGLDGSRVVQLLNGHGYRLFRFDAASGSLTPVSEVMWSGHENLYALHDVEQVRARLVR